MITGKINLPPCRCGDPDRFHDAPCRPPATQEIVVLCPFCGGAKPTTLESVVRSPRFCALLRDPNQVNDRTLDDAIFAAALRIAALDAADQAAPRQTWDDAVSDPLKDVCAIARQIAGRKEPPPSPEGRSPRPEEVKP